MTASQPMDIAIFVDGEPERVTQTLCSIRAVRERGQNILVLRSAEVDGLRCAADTLTVVGGRAAAMNTLLRQSCAPTIVFLENGAWVTAGALRRLVAALEVNVGISGPSTNFAWKAVARRLISAMERGRSRVVIGTDAHLISLATRISPRLVQFAARRLWKRIPIL